MADRITARMSRQLARRVEEKRQRLDYFRPLAPDVVRYLHRDLRVVLTHHSNAIEGNTLDLNETRLILEEGLTVGGHPLREYIEATSHALAFDYMEGLVGRREPIDLTAILTLHLLMMENLLALPGSLRQVAVYIRGARWTPPPAREVPRLLDEWLVWVAGEGEKYPPIERAAIAHSRFEAIHPFIDGNGRVGRLLLNLMLMRDGYPPAIVLRQWRADYLAALEGAQVYGRYRPIVNLVGRAVEVGLDIYLATVDAAAEPLSPLAELAAEFGYSVDYLGSLARSGRLKATKQAGRWYAQRQELANYKARAAAERRGRPRSRQG